MTSTIDQALQQGVAAHKEGKLHEAERFYRAILKAQAKHPDANHNLGVLAVAVGKPLEAIPLFKQALEANPQIEQFWLSYIDALIKVGRLDDAKYALVEGEKSGVSSEKLEFLYKQIPESPPDMNNNSIKQGLTLSENRKRLAEKKKSNERQAQTASSSAGPSQDQRNRLLEYSKARRLAEAEALAASLIQTFPSDPFAWTVLGTIYSQAGRPEESLRCVQNSVQLSPRDFSAHYNCGVMQQALGRLDEAEASYRQAIALKSDSAILHYKLGTTLKALGRLEEACEAYVCAVNLNPGFSNAFVNLGQALRNVRFYGANRSLYPALSDLLTARSFVRPKNIAKAVISLLKHDPVMMDLLARSEPSVVDIEGVITAIAALHQLPLLHDLMRICPLPDLKLEGLFESIRRLLILSLKEIQESPELTNFLSTLSLQCFVNEYVYFETEDEYALVGDLETEIAECVAQGVQPTFIGVLCFAAYRPLHQYAWSEALQVLDQLPEIRRRLIGEPLAERVLAQQIPVLADVKDEVSRKVKDQYEENPYPRWVNLGIPVKPKSLARICTEAELELGSEDIKNVSNPSILIAGCGTGQHSIGSACRYSDCKVTAVDLSLTSLAYAQRKTTEHDVSNIEYLQADILQLGKLDRTFDIIESTGVLHHMEDPMAGWRILTGLLNVGGLMKIGLYSDLARQHIVAIREEIAMLGIKTSAADMRGFRKSLAESHDEHKQRLVTSNDFFSLSTVRDLIFHVQEHRFTLPQIQACLNELGLRFCGFEKAYVAKFREFHGKQSNVYDLMLWHELEKSQPRTFASMYQFWCQKL